MQLSIVIVNYKTPDLLIQCLESILETVPTSLVFEVIVVDNNSNDNSERTIKLKFPDVTWIQKEENDGFGRANNIGIKQARGIYILLLNTDIVLLPGTVENCLNVIQNDPSIGALGCQLLNADGTVQKSTYTGIGNASDILKDNLVLDRLFKLATKKREIRAVMGSFMLMQKATLEKVGLFDPDFFMYSEEIDLCRRMGNNNFKIIYHAEVSAMHKQGGSSTGEDWSTKQKLLSSALLQYKSRGLLNYIFYHFLYFSNTFVNFFAMWLLDHNYRNGYWLEQKFYFSNLYYYMIIPLFYSRSIGDGKRLLRRG